APYSAHQYKIYHCPGDVYVSKPQAAVGWSYRCRSVSMDEALGFGTRATEFNPWDLNIQKMKLTDLHNPGPADVWVFLDEAPDSINDAMMYVNPYNTATGNNPANGGNWVDWPGSMH